MKTLSVTISDQLYQNLKGSVPTRRISKFVSEALERYLSKQQESLYQAYQEAAQDSNREDELSDWDNINVESWT